MRVVAAMALGGYLVVARIAGNLYPFSTFGMYSDAPARSASRIVARDGAGAVHELTEFAGYRCERPLDLSSCRDEGDVYTIDYVDREAKAYVESSSAGPPGIPIGLDVVRRIWRLEGGRGDPKVDDCLLARCTAVRAARGGGP